MASPHRIGVDDPDVDMDLAQRLLCRDELFTGEVAEYQNGQLVCLDDYVNGVRDGSSRAWYPDGTLKLEGTVRNGVALGEFKEWHANGVLKSRQMFDNYLYDLRQESVWDEEGRLVRDWHRE
ncbi:toxin-antitoxin system YwqK family antitoxin [Streptomyces sp. NPDC090036]|uniref:toxin-antitoxin system YwqK family antitoxin n=1 Tax=Streptomyces sp. NPDC090036 TaxID=3365926 RepID=UPI0038065DB7